MTSSTDSDGDFSSFVGDAKPLKTDERAIKNTTLGGNDVRHRLRRENAVQQEGDTTTNYLPTYITFRCDPSEEVEWKEDGVQPGVFAMLRSGSYAVEDSVDLHNRSVSEAREIIWTFLQDALKNDCRTLLIVHGKGIQSDPPATMKSYVVQCLKQHNDVLAFCSAPRVLGGVGSTLVQVRKSERARETTREKLGSKSS